MVYYKDDELVIRDLEEADAQVFTDEERAQGWNADLSKYLMRLRDQADQKCISLTAEYQRLHYKPGWRVQRKRMAGDR